MPELLKKQLRQAFRERRAGLGPAGRAEAGRTIVNTLVRLPEYVDAEAVAAFWPFGDEIDVRPFINHALAGGRRVYLPRVNKAEERIEFCPFDGEASRLLPNPFGIPEPQTAEAPVAQIDFVLVPGLAFDLHRHRLGYGAGYYDRFLKTVRAATVGVAFDIQTIDILPVAEHDVAVDMVVTESRVF